MAVGPKEEDRAAYRQSSICCSSCRERVFHGLSLDLTYVEQNETASFHLWMWYGSTYGRCICRCRMVLLIGVCFFCFFCFLIFLIACKHETHVFFCHLYTSVHAKYICHRSIRCHAGSTDRSELQFCRFLFVLQTCNENCSSSDRSSEEARQAHAPTNCQAQSGAQQLRWDFRIR